jgi:hypothetical protein
MSKARSGFIVAFAVLLLSGIARAQTISDSAISNLITQFSSSDVNVRTAAFYGLLDLAPPVAATSYSVPPQATSVLQNVSPQTAEQIRLGLIALLATENGYVDPYWQPTDGPGLTEDYTDYYADVVAAVASLNDTRSIGSLAGALRSGDTPRSALAAFRDSSIDQLLLQLVNIDNLVQFSTVIAMEEMLDPANFPNLSAGTIGKLRQGFTQALQSADPDVASEATQALAKLSSLADTVPPTTAAALSPQPNGAGWNNTNVTVTLNATDNEPGGTGVKQITYSAAGAQNIGSTVANGASTSFAIGTEGITTITFFGTDNAGNVEGAKTVTIQLDKTPPTIIPVRTPAPNANGWNNTNVTTSFVCADSLSGLAPGSPPAPTVLSAEGAGQSVSGTCTDVAGNSATSTVSGINIDKTPPVITASANPSTLWAPNGKMVNVIVSGTITDTTSGVNLNSAHFAVVDKYGSVQPSGNVILGANGTYSFTVSLEARRDGQDMNGRLYTITVNAQDNAGNAGSATTTVIVPHDRGN